MASLKQIQANRLNARKSTGPRSVEGKAVSRMNALQSGIDAEAEIILGEDPDHLQALRAEYAERFQPATPEERFFLETLVRDDWQLRRLARVDAQIWENGFDDAYNLSQDNPLGQIFNQKSGVFMRLQRRIDATQRSYKQTLRELERLQAARTAPEPAAAPEPVSAPSPQRPQNPTTSPQIGFVPQLPVTPPPVLIPGPVSLPRPVPVTSKKTPVPPRRPRHDE